MASVDDVWSVDFGAAHPRQPADRRPAIVVGPPGTFGTRFPYVILVPLTTTRRDLPIHVEIEPTRENGLDGTSYAQCELLRSVNTERLLHRLGTIDPETARAVDRVLRTLLDH